MKIHKQLAKWLTQMFSPDWFLTCRGSRLDGDGRRFDHWHYGSLHRLDDDCFGLQGSCSLSNGKCSDEWFRLNGNFRAQTNGPQGRFNYKQKKNPNFKYVNIVLTGYSNRSRYYKVQLADTE